MAAGLMEAFVLEPEVIDHIADDDTLWEQEPLRSLAADGRLAAYHHTGFWQPMDTLRDRVHLEKLWARGRAPWGMVVLVESLDWPEGVTYRSLSFKGS